MIFKYVNKYKYLLTSVYVFFLLVLIAILGFFLKLQIAGLTPGAAVAAINPSFYLMPLLAYGSIGLVGLTIGFTRKTASEKNALDFEKTMSELRYDFKVIYQVRQQMLMPNGHLDRHKATAYMRELEKAVLAEKAKAAAAKEKEKEKKEAGNEEGASGEQKEPEAKSESAETVSSTNTPTASEAWTAAGKILNSLEGCANAIRYGIYDEDFIYNVYGSQFINFYELTYGFIKTRQVEVPRVWVNFEWLAVKWTLRRKITGVISKEWEETSYIIHESLAAIKEHTKIRPDPKKLKKFERKLERRKFPA